MSQSNPIVITDIYPAPIPANQSYPIQVMGSGFMFEGGLRIIITCNQHPPRECLSTAWNDSLITAYLLAHPEGICTVQAVPLNTPRHASNCKTISFTTTCQQDGPKLSPITFSTINTVDECRICFEHVIEVEKETKTTDNREHSSKSFTFYSTNYRKKVEAFGFDLNQPSHEIIEIKEEKENQWNEQEEQQEEKVEHEKNHLGTIKPSSSKKKIKSKTKNSPKDPTHRPTCPHGEKNATYCRQCKPDYFCQHDRLRRICKECGGVSICQHGKRRTVCKECGGRSLCEHGRQRQKCISCGGKSLCEHGRTRTRCRYCGGGSICQHEKIRTDCAECGGGSICKHRKRRRSCKECKPTK